ncbi:protein CUSTOS [Plectropomus leopardus]|uniref:protein CUSTOS n=1 Tax=Plectropomus leopardus TaxID=160734 RepID=UPI001C4C5996|nr:protein CUSTOS [Plectropomus leopardus]
MAAPAVKMVGVSDSSSSDDEVLKRCREAVWETRSDKKKDGDSNVQQSKRVVVADHDHDGNNLQVTQGFQTHVAKKLGHFLDSSITEMKMETFSRVQSAKCDDDDGGFRLFSTSVPGQTVDDPPAPVRRRPVPSSSDSDSEMETRLREAAVSVKHLLPPSSLPSTLSAPSAELPCSEKIKKKRKEAEGEESHVVKKKKKKRKQTQEESEQADSVGSPLNAHRNGEHGDSEQEHTQVKVKRKKKKKRELHTEEAALN